MAEQGNELELLDKLDDLLGRLDGGSLEIGAFNTWFMSSEWEARMANNSSALRLGWDIQNILYEWQDFPDLIPVSSVVKSIRSSAGHHRLKRRSVATQQQLVDPGLVRLIKQVRNGTGVRAPVLGVAPLSTPRQLGQYRAETLSNAVVS